MKRSGAGVYTSITDNTSNWDTAFGWGNHASQGYLTQLPVHGLGVHTGVTLTNETAGDLLRYVEHSGRTGHQTMQLKHGFNHRTILLAYQMK